MKTFSYFLLSLIFSVTAYSQQKEVLLIGTMHKVPKIAKGSYKPLLRRAIKYNPKTIYVESPLPNDTLSWEYLKNGWSNAYKKFYKISDSLKTNFDYNQEKLNKLLKKDFSQITNSQLDYIIKSFGYLRDNANYKFYTYLRKYGINGSKKPTRHEDGDLTAKLALKLGIKRLKSMDDQSTGKEYHLAWKKCARDGQTNGDNKINNKLNKKHYNSAILPTILGKLGIHTNNRKSLERLHKLASFTYVRNKTHNCSIGEKYWNERNKRMAKNIGEQIRSGSEIKNVVIVGASHIIGIEKELKKNYPNLKIKLITD